MNDNPTFSVIVPVYNEQESLPELYSRITAVMDGLSEPWELLLVDDGSVDNSQTMIKDLAEKDSKVRPVIFARNFGHQIAVSAGLDFSRGKAVVVLDADLQDPPEVIPELVEQWRNGFEVVYAVRDVREGETAFKKMTAAIFYRMINKITTIDIPLDTGDFRLMDRRVVQILNNMPEHHRFIRGMSAWAGFKQVGVSYARASRFAGDTHYPLSKMLQLAFTAITSFSSWPLQVGLYLGFASAGISLVAIPVVILMRLAGSQAFLGQASTLIAVLFFGGVQLITIGFIGDYIGRLYDDVRARPLYVLREAPDSSPEDK